MALILLGMLCIGVFVFRHQNNQDLVPKKGIYPLLRAFLAKLPFWLKLLWWLILFSAIIVSALNTSWKQ